MTSKKIITFIAAAIMVSAVFSGCGKRKVAESIPEIVSEAESSVERPLDGDLDGQGEIVDDGDGTYIDEETSESESSSDMDESSTERLNPDVSDNDDPIMDGANPTSAAVSADFSKIGALSGAKDIGFPGGPADSLNRPSGPLSYQQKYGKYDAYFIIPDSQKIYLTFDEGYENGYTSRILDILKEKNVKACFFITYPYAKSEPALVTRMIAEGHTLGNHSVKHLIFPDMPLEDAANDIMTLHNYMLANYGYEMSLFRPPEGAFSEQTLALAQQIGYNTMLWSFAYRDYDVNNQPITLEATSNIVNKAHPGEICLLHAVSRTNSEILGDVIDQLRAKGFEFADYFYFK